MKHLKLVVDGKGTKFGAEKAAERVSEISAETQKEQKGTILAERGHFSRKRSFRQKEVISAERTPFGFVNSYRKSQFLQNVHSFG